LARRYCEARAHAEKKGGRAPGLIIASIDHAQRSDAHRDIELVRGYCQRFDLPFVSRKLRLGKNASEAELRKARYEALAGIAAKAGAQIILTAHHANDDLETILFRLIRGAHPETLHGIQRSGRLKTREGSIRVLRPMLAFSKAELVEYARAVGLSWREDSTNQNPRFARNRIRHELVPLLESLRPGASVRIRRFFHDLNEIRPEPIGVVTDLGGTTGVEVRNIQFHALKGAIDQVLGDSGHRTSRGQWESLRRILSTRQLTRTGGGPSKTVQFPGGHRVRFEGNRLFWE
jgi:tRNA(Ile)-lysidine synthetase-like protein